MAGVYNLDGSLRSRDLLTMDSWLYAASVGGIVNTVTPVTIKAAAGTNKRNVITNIQLYSEALGAATEVVIRDGSSGPVLWRSKIGLGGLLGAEPIVTKIAGSENTLLEVVTLTASITGAVYFNAQGFVD